MADVSRLGVEPPPDPSPATAQAMTRVGLGWKQLQVGGEASRESVNLRIMLVSLACVMVSEMILQRGSWSQGEDRAVRSAKTQIGNLFAIEEPIVCWPCVHEGGRGGTSYSVCRRGDPVKGSC